MKKIIISLIVLIFIVILYANTTFVYGFSIDDMQGSDLPGGTQTAVNNFGQGVIGVITTIGSICSVLVLIVLGIKYMIGSTEERAEYKKSLFPYFVGALILFGASSIAGIIYNIAISL